MDTRYRNVDYTISWCRNWNSLDQLINLFTIWNSKPNFPCNHIRRLIDHATDFSQLLGGVFSPELLKVFSVQFLDHIQSFADEFFADNLRNRKENGTIKVNSIFILLSWFIYMIEVLWDLDSFKSLLNKSECRGSTLISLCCWRVSRETFKGRSSESTTPRTKFR